MNAGSPFALLFYAVIIVAGYGELHRIREERAWRRDQERCDRRLAASRYPDPSGLSDDDLAEAQSVRDDAQVCGAFAAQLEEIQRLPEIVR